MIKQTQPNELNRLQKLFEFIRNKTLRDNFFLKKYSSWNNLPLFAFQFEENNDLKGFLGTNCIEMVNDNEKIVVAQLCDLIMKQEFQGKGYFSKLIETAEVNYSKNNIDYLVVFPNKRASVIFENRKNWEKFGAFHIFQFDVKTYPLLKTLNKVNKSSWFFMFGKIFNSYSNPKKTWKKTNSIKSFYTEKSTAFFEYKKYSDYLIHTINSKEIVWSLSDGIIINATQVENELELLKEINSLKKFCKIRGIHQFSYVCHSNSLLFQLLLLQNDGKEMLPTYVYDSNKNKTIPIMDFDGFDRNAF